MDLAEESGIQSEEERADYVSLQADLWKAEKNVNSLWMQKSRLNCNDEGDKNIKFFHRIASPKDIQLHIRNFYISLYSRATNVSFDITDLHFDAITDEQTFSLIKPFDQAKVFNAIASCGSKKAPDLDGFNFYFYQKAWFVMKGEIADFFKKFHDFGTLSKGINSSFMVLIPKVAGSSNFKDYHPISLVNGFYKILSKALTTRKLIPPILATEIPSLKGAG
ncbi:uncharacterized protein LOC126656881 [Mercurialis annua]|uniref:uncharacterized protein LOC126656881 n=1 Tax=Mercurialis annua TaxID=3986 RepID=UPI00215EF5AB|nr:uncharacterized protein LOC126656881 [Mercurialis annua]